MEKIALIIPAILIIWVIFLEWRFYCLHKNYLKIYNGKKSTTTEGLVKEIVEDLDEREKEIIELGGRIKDLENIIPKAAQKIAIIRYNPFKEVGSDQSFSLAILDADNNGIVISSLFSRDNNRVYGKPIKSGHSKYELLEEEKEVIKKAIQE